MAMSDSSLPRRFAEWVACTPDAVAVSSDARTLTYRELDEQAGRLARRLLELGVRPEDPVAVLMERSADVVVAFLGILKAGAAYLPLHDTHPPERLSWIIEQAGAPLLVTDEAARARGLPETGAAVVDGSAAHPGPPAQVDVGPDRLAYVIYTSGSTGHPKGVAVTHRNVLGLVADSCWATGGHERVLMVAPHAFNVSTYEIWVTLLNGGRVVVAPAGGLEVSALGSLIRRERVTAVHLTAGLFRVVAEEAPECLAGVREVLTGGDVIAPTAVRRVLDACPDTVVRAMYGATETTVFASHAPITAPGQVSATVPVGEAMDDVRLYVLDDRLSPVPPGVVGEVYIAGRGLARGYFGRADLTAERFVADPFGAPGARMYRTGDLMRRDGDGGLEFLGRENDQVKILGFRVELAEVEAVLARFPGLAHVAVVARETPDGEKRLVAYVVPDSAGVDPAELRAHAGDALPEYMVPTAFVTLDALPLTPNGKLDRRALPEPEIGSGVPYRAPRDARQELLCGIFAEVLTVPRVGIDDSIFDLGGGQSLTAMRLVGRIRTALGVDLTVATLFDAPTVAALTKRIENAEPTRPAS